MNVNPGLINHETKPWFMTIRGVRVPNSHFIWYLKKCDPPNSTTYKWGFMNPGFLNSPPWKTKKMWFRGSSNIFKLLPINGRLWPPGWKTSSNSLAMAVTVTGTSWSRGATDADGRRKWRWWKVSCKVAPYCQVLILGISRNQPINRWCMKTIQSIHHEKNLRDLEIRLFFQVYVQSLRDWKSWGLRWGILRILFIWVGRLLRGCRLRTVWSLWEVRSVEICLKLWNAMTYVTKTMVFEKVWNKKKLNPINVEKPMVPWAVWNTAKSERRIIFQLFVCGIRMAWAMGFPWLNSEGMLRETGCYHENVNFGVRFLFTWPDSSQPRLFWICFAEKRALRELTGIPVEQKSSFFRWCGLCGFCGFWMV